MISLYITLITQVYIDRQIDNPGIVDRQIAGCVGFYPANSQGDDVIANNPDNPGIHRQIDNPGIDRQIQNTGIDR